MAHRITKRGRGTGRRKRSPNDIWTQLDVSLTDMNKMRIINRLLRLCHQDMFELAERNMMNSISLPPIAAELGFPAREASDLTLAVIREYLDTEHSYEATLRRVIICGLDQAEMEPYREATPNFSPKSGLFA